jgi:hypothetical protein
MIPATGGQHIYQNNSDNIILIRDIAACHLCDVKNNITNFIPIVIWNVTCVIHGVNMFSSHYYLLL